jgi:hypothetical protein
MARVKFIVLTAADVARLEGCIQTLADTDSRYRPKATAVDFIAAQLGVTPRVVREWIRRARPMARRTDITEAFWCVYEKIASLLVESIEAAIYATAATVGGRDQMKAALWLAPRVHPERYGDAVEEDSADVLAISDVEQEAFDVMTPEQLLELERAQQQVIDAQARAEAVIKEARAKVLANEINASRVH